MEEYGLDLEENLKDLAGRLARMGIDRNRCFAAIFRNRAARRSGLWGYRRWRIE